jgi:hypothetical protein
MPSTERPADYQLDIILLLQTFVLLSLQVIGPTLNAPIYVGMSTNICSLFPSPNFPVTTRR